MGITKKTLPYILALGIGLSSLTPQIANAQEKEYATREEAMEVLKINNPRMIEMNLPDGYKTSKHLAFILRDMAGIYAGTCIATKKGNSYNISGSYNPYQSSNIMLEMLKVTDRDKDKIITEKETQNLKSFTFEEFAK